MTKFGERYELIRRIGAGGMGEVWLAHDEALAGRPVAIKIMHQHMLPNEEDVGRFEREMRFAARMDHPNIVTVYTTGTWDGAPFMVMEYLRGHDLEQALPGGDAEHIAAIGRDICSGLAYAHREGVLHRDIKPANLFLCESGQVKITDFGVARAIDSTTYSTVGVIVGTLAYMPPERWRGEPPAFSNDVWAVGCVLYRLISGRLPRVLPDVAGYAAAATRGDPVPDLRGISGAPAWLADPVMAMLADDPADRPTAAECAQLLSSAQFPAPVAGLPVRSRHLPGQLGPDTPRPFPVTDPDGEDGPTTAPVTQPDGRPAGSGRRRPAGRGAFALAGLLILLVAGSITAWRLTAAPGTQRLVANGAVTGSPASGGAGSTRSASPSAPRSAAAPQHSAVASPPTYRPTYPASSSAAGSRPASPTGSPTAKPLGSPSASATPSLIAVPDVVGMKFTAASLELQKDGFLVVGRHTRTGQLVTRTNPAGGRAPAGSVIIVVYGTGTLLLRATARSRGNTRPDRRFSGAEQVFSDNGCAVMIMLPNPPKPN